MIWSTAPRNNQAAEVEIWDNGARAAHLHPALWRAMHAYPEGTGRPITVEPNDFQTVSCMASGAMRLPVCNIIGAAANGPSQKMIQHIAS